MLIILLNPSIGLMLGKKLFVILSKAIYYLNVLLQSGILM